MTKSGIPANKWQKKITTTSDFSLYSSMYFRYLYIDYHPVLSLTLDIMKVPFGRCHSNPLLHFSTAKTIKKFQSKIRRGQESLIVKRWAGGRFQSANHLPIL